MPKPLEGIFLPAHKLSEDDYSLIWEAVREEGFSENGEGVLELLMLFLRGEREPADAQGFSEKVFSHFKKHPEDFVMLQNAGKAGLQALLKKILG